MENVTALTVADVYNNVLVEVDRNRDTHYTVKDYHKNNDNINMELWSTRKTLVIIS